MKHFQRILKDWTFLGLIVAAAGLLVSLGARQMPIKESTIGILLVVWILTVSLLYGRILQVLAEIRNVKIEARNKNIARDLIVISVEDFIQRESRLSKGDSVLVFTNTLEH